MLTAGFLLACHSVENKQTTPQTEQETKIDTAEKNEATVALSLNKGAKWKADSSTNSNVSGLRNIIENAKPVNLEGYHNTGKDLQEGINKMVSECRMKGPEHESLHHWLQPLMEENKKLTSAGSITVAAETVEKIKKQLSLYPHFFEQ